jgi:hypothetical protein
MAANPASNTPLSSKTEIRCNFPNSASNGLSADVAWIDPICTRSAAIFGLTACCDSTVSKIISTTQSAAGATKLANVRDRKSRATRIAIPQITPIKCIHQSPFPTIAPAWSRLANIRNALGATTKLKNTSLPSHKLNPRNSRVRSKLVMAALYKAPLIPATRPHDRHAPTPPQPCLHQLLNIKFGTTSERELFVSERCGRIGRNGGRQRT